MGRVLYLIFIAGVFLAFFTPMELGDIWWHLKTGQWIWQNNALPLHDPFGIAPPPQAGEEGMVLKAFWLCQLVLYGTHRLFGVYGLIGLKAIIFLLSFLLIEGILKDYGLKRPLGYIVLLPSIYMATFYDEIRPQTFTFLFFTAVIYLLEKWRLLTVEGSWTGIRFKPFLFLPLLMLIWSNMHAGFTSGIALIAFYSAGCMLGLIHRADNKARFRDMAVFLSVCLSSIGATVLNPNGLKAIGLTIDMLRGSFAGSSGIHEHMSTAEFSAFTGTGTLYGVLIFCTATALGSFLLRLKRPDIYLLLLLPAFAYASFITFRAGIFFLVIAGVTIGKNLSVLKPAEKTLRYITFLLITFLLFSVLVLLPRTAIKRPAIDSRLIPVKVSAFIESEGLPRNLFHPYEWGGYLIWRLYPDYRVFIDGRAIGHMREYSHVVEGGPGSMEILNRFGVNTVIFWPVYPYGGRVPGIVLSLLKDPEWSPVYWDLSSIAFVRAHLAKRPISKGSIWELLSALITAGIMKSPSAHGYISMGIVYLEQGLRYPAKEAFQNALKLEPGNKEAAFYLSSLR